MIHLLLIEDHSLLRHALHILINEYQDIQVVAEADTFQKAEALVDAHHPDVVLIDIDGNDRSWSKTITKLKSKSPATAFIALTIYDDNEYINMMLKTGINGFIPKRTAPKELYLAIQTAARGETYISPSRE